MNNINVKLEIILFKLLKETQKASKHPESLILILVLDNCPNKLSEIAISHMFEAKSVVEILVGPLNKIDVCCYLLSFTLDCSLDIATCRHFINWIASCR